MSSTGALVTSLVVTRARRRHFLPRCHRSTLAAESDAVPFLVQDHEHHVTTFDVLAGRRLGLAGHAAFETYAVLTRLPAPARRTPAAAAHLIRAGFPHTVHLDAGIAAGLLDDLAATAIGGGSTYDALVGAVAASARRQLVTRDRRALDTYRAVGANVLLLA